LRLSKLEVVEMMSVEETVIHSLHFKDVICDVAGSKAQEAYFNK
jgi:hypothetical protein